MKIELKIGKWYKKIWKDGDVDFFHVYGIDEKGVIDDKTQYWRNGKCQSWKLSKLRLDDRFSIVEATQKEVHYILETEAVKRGFGLDIPFNPVNNTEKIVCPYGNIRFGFDMEENKLLLNNHACFINGVWAKITYPKTIKSKKTNRLDELEKRISVLENKVDLKKIADMPENPIKINFGIDFRKPDSHNDILSSEAEIRISEKLQNDLKNGKLKVGYEKGGDYHCDMVDAMQHAMKVTIPNYIKGGVFNGQSKLFPETVNWSAYPLHIKDFKLAFDSIDTDPKKEVNKLKLRIEELEAENAAILAGGKSKWEKEIEELKTHNKLLQRLASENVGSALDKLVDELFDKIQKP